MTSPTSDTALDREHAGARIGRYKLVQIIGQGGFGVVWLAEQEEPVRRQVALKILKLGMDTKQVVARFEAERQALALMDHPGIAKVLDGGATDAGRPYFVMELVHGTPITKFCDEHALAPRQRLELFRQVCAAIQHAHQKGVIHRDIKPNNVLVTEHDGAPAPKVIDFGIAKATAGSLTDLTLVTEYRQFIGTPEYMAPEQASASVVDIDTRADIYSLGVVLYELLTGTKPFELKSLVESGYDEVLRHIREIEPPKPSTRISTLGDDSMALVAQRRGFEPRRLSLALRGDLDWIVMKALEKERSRRYDSAAALADDVGRFLADQPVLASPPSTLYRVRKYVRRHRFGVAAGLAIAIALIVGLVASTLALSRAVAAEARVRDQFAIAESERKLADEQRTAAENSERTARVAAAKAEKLADFAQNMLSRIDPSFAQGLDTKLIKSVLDDSAQRIESELASEPEVAAAMHVTVGRAYMSIASFVEAEKHFRTAEKLYVAQLGDEARPTLRARKSIGLALSRQSKFAEARAILEPTFDAQRRVLGADDRDTLDTQVRLGDALWFEDHGSARGLELLRDAHARCERAFGPDDPDTDAAMFALAQGCWGQHRNEEAEKLMRQLLAARERKGEPNQPGTINALATLALVLRGDEHAAEAKALYREALARARRVYGSQHQSTLTIINNFANRLDAPDELEEAEALAREAYEGRVALFGEANLETLTSLSNRAEILEKLRRLDEAEALRRHEVDVCRRNLPALEYDLRDSLSNLAHFLDKHGSRVEAAELFGEAARLKRKTLGDDDRDVWLAYYNWAAALQNTGRNADAEPVFRELIELHDEHEGKEEPFYGAALNGLGKCLRARGEYDEATRWSERGLEVRRRILPSKHVEIGFSLFDLGITLMVSQQYERAEPVLRECLDLLRTSDRGNLDIATVTGLLGRALGEQGRFEDGEPLVIESCNELEQLGNLARIRDAFANAIAFYERWDEHDGEVADQLENWRDKLAELPENGE